MIATLLSVFLVLAASLTANGNMLTDGSYGDRTYAYDAFGRLVEVSGNGVDESYTLDGAGNRWAETVNTVTTDFDLDLAASYPTILADGTNLYLPEAPSAGYSAGGTWYSALTDLRGSQLGFVDDQRSVSSTFTAYDPFGAPLPGSSAAVGVGFTGEWQSASGLLNLRARSYDPVLARFVGRDSFGGLAALPQSANRYTFGQTNQLLAVDPSGHFVNHYLAPTFNFITSPEGIQFIASVTPVVSTLYFGGSLLAGHDLITGEQITDTNRVSYIAGFGLSLVGDLPAINAGLRMVGNTLERLVPRAGEALSGLRLGDRLGGVLDRLGMGRLFSREGQLGSLDLGRIAERFGGLRGTRLGDDLARAAETAPKPIRGETEATRYGRQMHKTWDYGSGFNPEYTLPSGRRVDAVNFGTGEVIELKPNNPRAIRLGVRQLEGYLEELRSRFPSTQWTGRVVTYDR